MLWRKICDTVQQSKSGGKVMAATVVADGKVDGVKGGHWHSLLDRFRVMVKTNSDSPAPEQMEVARLESFTGEQGT